LREAHRNFRGFSGSHSCLIRGDSVKDKPKTGFALITGEIVIVQDTDVEYEPLENQSVIQPIVDGVASVVYGSRFLVRKATRALSFYHYLGNKFLTFTSNLLTNLNMTDVKTCYKSFRGDIIRNRVIVSSGFGFEIEVTAKIAKLGLRYLRSSHQLLWKNLRAGQEDRAQRWDCGHLVYLPL
jgi:hypothetical protein